MSTQMRSMLLTVWFMAFKTSTRVFDVIALCVLIAGVFVWMDYYSDPSGPAAPEPSTITKQEIRGLIRIHRPSDVENMRRELYELLWGPAGFPKTRLPDGIEQDIEDARFANITNLRQIDRITVKMDHAINSMLYHFLPTKPNGQLIVYHQGHLGGFERGVHFIARAVEAGYAVLAASMPLIGSNPKPMVQMNSGERIRLDNHNQFRQLPQTNGHPVRFFVEPLIAALNYAEKFSYNATHMVGFSGGGWTTTFYSALDPRIERSYPVAGTLPFHLRTEPTDRGDFEQSDPPLYRIANYLELYVLGSYGPKRRQYQLLNRDDPCCYRGNKNLSYREVVHETVRSIGGGSFDVFVDPEGKTHSLSAKLVDEIFDDLP